MCDIFIWVKYFLFFMYYYYIFYENDILWVIYLKNKNPPHLKYFLLYFQ